MIRRVGHCDVISTRLLRRLVCTHSIEKDIGHTQKSQVEDEVEERLGSAESTTIVNRRILRERLLSHGYTSSPGLRWAVTGLLLVPISCIHANCTLHTILSLLYIYNSEN